MPKHRSQKRIALFLMTSLLVGLTAIGCAMPSVEAPASPAATAPIPDDAAHTPSRLQIDTLAVALPADWVVQDLNADGGHLTDGDSEIQFSVLRFEGNGDTLQSAIDAAMRQNPNAAHRTLTTQGGARQGTLIIGADQSVAFVQPPRGGAAVALHAQGPNTPAVNDLFANLMATSTEPTPPPDVAIEFIEASETAPGIWSFAVTLRHPDTGWDDYTDAWQVLTPEGEILGTRVMLHPHETEQPFTRSLSNVEISEETTTVEIVAHDLLSGFGAPVTVVIAQSGAGENYRVTRE
ncbi:MAG: hypothetical protein R2873_30135 [Caldilineaceae bacterium]